MKRTNLWFLPLLFCSALLGLSHAAYAAGLEVRYDRERDRLSVQAEQVPLTQVLGRIAAQSGVEILMDPSIEKTVSMSLQWQPLERALKQIARGLSYVMLYDSGKQRNPTQTPRLTTMKLLPQGKQDSPNLVPVAVLNARAGRQAKQRGDDRNGSGYSDRIQENQHSAARHKPKQPAKKLSPEELAAQGIAAVPKNNNSSAKRQNKTTNKEPKAVNDVEGGPMNNASSGDQ